MRVFVAEVLGLPLNLIREETKLTPEQADQVFRNMLEACSMGQGRLVTFWDLTVSQLRLHLLDWINPTPPIYHRSSRHGATVTIHYGN